MSTEYQQGKDIGETRARLESLAGPEEPFQRYEMIEGEVQQVSPDSSELPDMKEEKKHANESQGNPLSYRALVTLKTPYLSATASGTSLHRACKLRPRSILAAALCSSMCFPGAENGA